LGIVPYRFVKAGVIPGNPKLRFINYMAEKNTLILDLIKALLNRLQVMSHNLWMDHQQRDEKLDLAVLRIFDLISELESD
jgi:hypothetical protein